MTRSPSRATTSTATQATPRIPAARVAPLPGSAGHHWQWQTRAACRDLGWNRFFHPADERGEDREQRDAAAKRVCAECPVRAACLEHALRTRETYGVWGGLTEEERRTLVRSRSGRSAAGGGAAGGAAAPATAPEGRTGRSGPATRAPRK
ncbi:WhiB family transcriptional regulator [Streptomyces sp. NPDC003952]